MVMRWRSVDIGRRAARLACSAPPDREVRDGRFGRAAVAVVASVVVGTAALGGGAPAALAADHCPNAQYRTGAAESLPDCRAYEQVSAQRKFGNAVWALPPVVGGDAFGDGLRVPAWTSAGGDRLLFNAVGGAGTENAVRGYQLPQVAERHEAGWVQRAAIDGPPLDRPLTGANTLPRLQLPSRDRAGMMFSGFMPFSPLQPDVVNNNGHGAVHLVDATGSVHWLSQPMWAGADLPPGTPGLNGNKFVPVGMSDDLATSYFMTRQTLTPADGASGRTWDQAWALYKVKDGVLSNAGALPDGTIEGRGSVSAGMEPLSIQVISTGTNNLSSTLGAVRVVSPDGKRALFLDVGNRATATPQVYMHRDGQSSLLISKRPSDPNVPASGAATGVVPIWGYSGTLTNDHGGSAAGGLSFASGDRELDVVVFATRDALLPGDPNDGTHVNTYRYDVASNSLEYLADLDHPGSAASRGQLGNVYGISDDATRILFWTPAGELKLWRHGASTLTLMTGLETSGDASTRGVRFSDDGRTVVFMSTRAGTVPGDPNHPAGNGPNQTQVYRFEEGVDATPRCLSCPPSGATAKGPATFDLFTPSPTGFGKMINSSDGAGQSRGISADGRKVYFTTSSTLDVRDRNAVADVYEWSVDRGVALLSSGVAESRGDGLLDVDSSGDNVFFVSEQQLTASDTDDIFDVYVARVGGGLPDPPPFDTEERCVPGTCQGAESGAPVVAAPVTALVAPVTVGQQRLLPAEKVKKASVRVRRGKSSRTRITLRVRVSGAGRITVRGKGLRTTRKSTKRARSYTVKPRLSKASRRTLKRKGRVRVRVKVRFAPKKGKAVQETVKVTIKRGSRSSGRGR